MPKQLKGLSRAGVRAAKTFSRDVPLYPTKNRKFPGPETTADEAADEMPPTPREMELFNARISKQKRTATGNHLKNSKSMGRRPRKSDTNQPLPPLSKAEHSNNAGLDSLLEMTKAVREIETFAPTEKMFNSGRESHERRTPSSPPRVHFLQKSHEGKLNVVPRLKIEKLISPRVQMCDSPRATLSSERSQSSEHAYTFGHAIPSPRSAFSDIGSSHSDGVNTPR